MLLLVLTFIMLGIGILAFALGRNESVDSCKNIVGLCFCCFAGVAIFFEMIFLAGTYMLLPGEIAANKQRYNTLTYQIENHLYDNNIGKKALYTEIAEWNADLASGKAMSDNIWVGVFYPDALYDFEYIDVGSVENGG